MLIAKLTGTPCPHCACRDAPIVERYKWFFTPMLRRRCRFCGKTFTEKENPDDTARPVEYDPEPARCRCPKCAAKNPKVVKTEKTADGTVRHHRCPCGAAFKTVQS